MKNFRLGRVTCICAFLILLPSLLTAGEATKQLRATIDSFVPIISNTPREELQKNGMPERARKLVLARFDFAEMTKRSLGQHWTARTPAERSQFVGLFTDLMRQSYISKVDQHGGAKMVYRSETVDGDHAAVRTAIPLSNGSEMPLEYRMHNADARWQVYDLSIDGISLVSNYRAQFNKVIRTDSYETLVAKLKSHQFSAPAASPSGKVAP